MKQMSDLYDITDLITKRNATYNYLFKIIILGDSDVGKSTILNYYTKSHNKTKEIHHIEIILTSGIKIAIQLRNQKQINFTSQIDSVFIVYDVCNRISYDNISKWLNMVDQNDSHITIIGNKIDIKNRQVTEEEATDFASKNLCVYKEVSALNETNMNAIIDTFLIDELILACNMRTNKMTNGNRIISISQIRETVSIENTFSVEKYRSSSTIHFSKNTKSHRRSNSDEYKYNHLNITNKLNNLIPNNIINIKPICSEKKPLIEQEKCCKCTIL